MRAGNSQSSSPDPSRGALVPLSSLHEVRLADGEPDVRGWPVFDRDGRPAGRVEELLVDRAAGDVAAMVVSTGDTGAGLAVVPMADVQVDPSRSMVRADVTAESLASLAQAGTASQQTAAPPGVQVERTAEGEVITVPIIEEQLVVERRPVVKEVVVIRKQAVREERVIEADLRRERVDVDRRDTR